MDVLNSQGMRSRLLLGTLTFGLALHSSAARASELGGGSLVVQRAAEAAECPDEAALTASTLALGTLPPAAPGRLDLEVSFRREATGYSAEIRASGRSEGVRQVKKEGETCAPLAEAVSVVLAVLLDLTPRDAAPATAPTPPPPPAPAPPPDPRANLSTATEPTEPFGIGIGVEGGVAYALLGDGLAGTLSAAVRPRLSRWEGFAGVLWAPSGSASYLERSIDMSLLSGMVGGCGWLEGSRARADLGLCLGGLLGNLRAEGRGFSPDVPASDPWLALDAGLAGRMPFARKWALRLEISLVIPAWEQHYTVAGSSEVYESSPVAVLARLGPELTFP